MRTLARLAALSVVALAACTADHGEVALVVDFQNLPPAVDQVRFGGEVFAVVDGRAEASADFATYADGMAAGPLAVELVAQDAVVGTGAAQVGACTACVYGGCPALAALEVERIEYSGADISPASYGCFSCAGGDKLVKACP
ncbi:MAG: hypothetical protein KIT31_13475 [Deltaproteobacteria bacterium]|nr:hypothetical protein [Deltaproteobacteria bacterium]